MNLFKVSRQSSLHGSKSKSVLFAKEEFNVGLESIIYVDDNPSEIHDVTSLSERIWPVLANVDPLITKILVVRQDLCRGVDQSHRIRAQDLSANKERKGR